MNDQAFPNAFSISPCFKRVFVLNTMGQVLANLPFVSTGSYEASGILCLHLTQFTTRCYELLIT